MPQHPTGPGRKGRRNPRGRREGLLSPTSREALKAKYPVKPGYFPEYTPSPPLPKGLWKASAGTLITEGLARGINRAVPGIGYDDVKGMLDYGFQEVDGDGLLDIAKWAINPHTSYQEMPPGALRYELPANMLPGIGDLLALRDIWRDFHNKEMGGFTMLDIASLIPGAGVMVGLARHAGDLKNMGKMWRAVDEIRQLDPNILPEELFEMVRGQEGMTDAMAMRILDLEQPPGKLRTEAMEGERIEGIVVRKDGKDYVGEYGQNHTAIAQANGFHIADPGVERGFKSNTEPFVDPYLAQKIMEASGQTDIRLTHKRAVSEQFFRGEGIPYSRQAEINLNKAKKIGPPRPAQPDDTVYGAAVEINGETFVAGTHAGAVNRAADEGRITEEQAELIFQGGDYPDYEASAYRKEIGYDEGFTLNSEDGPFISREQTKERFGSGEAYDLRDIQGELPAETVRMDAVRKRQEVAKAAVTEDPKASFAQSIANQIERNPEYEEILRPMQARFDAAIDAGELREAQNIMQEAVQATFPGTDGPAPAVWDQLAAERDAMSVRAWDAENVAPDHFSSMLKRHTETGGSTADPRTGVTAPERYIVSGFEARGKELSGAVDEAGLRDYAKLNEDLLDQDGYYLGTWNDEGTDVLDVVVGKDDLEEAFRIGRQNNQKAIYDQETGQAIPVPASADEAFQRTYSQVDAEEFFEAMKTAGEKNPRLAGFHTARTLADWEAEAGKGSKFFLNGDGTAGGAVLSDGDMVNAFNAGAPRGTFVDDLMPILIQNGGTKADFFEGRLTEMYASYLDVVKRDPFDPQYGPGPEGRPADVMYAKVKPEVRERLGLEPEGEDWGVDRGIHERAITDYGEAEIMDNPARREDAWQLYLERLDPGERARILSRPASEQETNLRRFTRQLPPEAMASMAALGQQTRGWYKAAAKSLANIFGEDAPQVGALLAALSPNVGVPANNRMAMDLFTEWHLAGRPRDPDAIESLFELVRYNKGENTYRPSFGEMEAAGFEGAHGVVSNAVQNTVRVLSQENPVDFFSDAAKRSTLLRGNKVNPFFENLMENFDVFTNDTHMNRLSAMKYNNLGNRAAQTAAWNEAAQVLGEGLGIDVDMMLQVANMQEMAWEPGRQLSAMAGQRYGVEDLMFPKGGDIDVDVLGRLDKRMLEEGQDLSQLMREPETAANLQAGGFDAEQATGARTGLPGQEEAARAFALENQEGMRRMTRRMDMSFRGDYLNQAMPWLVGGEAARRGGLFSANEEDRRAPNLFGQ